MAEVEQKKRTFRKLTYCDTDSDQLLDMSCEQLTQLYSACQRRQLNPGLRRKQHSPLKRLRKAKKEAPPMEKPEVMKTHLRDMIILPKMVGSMVGVYNGKVEIRPEMIGHYLGEFSITYKPVKHCRPGIGATHSSRFIPLK
ncbi:small ribosomal subunit protein uS19-like [Hylobates moloch]|uniref:small ribosomal subunit protein uS19-like n=1 Tax=Hylobates moloch TaxID=81572 RepID=UPI0013F1F4F1|nr:small ribosomal subunit protein uS19-like [Hylobates moloch]